MKSEVVTVMSLSSFILNVKAELTVMEESKQATVKEYATVLTRSGFFRVHDNPGFLTSWWDETSDEVTMGPVMAVQELAIKIGINLLLMGSNMLRVFLLPFMSNDEYEHSKAERWCAASLGVLYYSVSLVVDLVSSLVAMITRTLSTAVLAAEATFETLRR